MADRKRILVVGCGAIGAVIAAHLSAVAHVTAYDTNAEHVDSINRDGLRLTGLSAMTARFPATTQPADLARQPFDAILLLTKSGQTTSVVDVLAPHLLGHPVWVTLQNGMGNSESLLALADVPVARGVTLNAGRYLGPGQVEFLIKGPSTWLGPVRATLRDCEWLGELLTVAGLPTQVIPDPMDAVWSKFVFNSVMNPVGALLLGVNAARYEVAEVRELIDTLAGEAIAVVTALGARLAFDPLDYVHKIRRGELPMSRHAGSMALDIARGAPTEIEELTGYIVREGERLGIRVAASKTVYQLIKGLERARSLQ